LDKIVFKTIIKKVIILHKILTFTLMAGSCLYAYNYGIFKENIQKCEQQENARACHNLGSMYLSGMRSQNVPEDKQKARFYYDRSIVLYNKHCKNGNGKACFELANKYNGMRWHIDQNLSKMAHYYAKSCEAEYGKACIELGAAYKRGNGVTKDQKISQVYYSKGIEYLTIECENDNADSCNKLSTIYQLNMYGTNDKEKGERLAKKSFSLYKNLCDDEQDDEGCFQTASAYKIGQKNIVEIDWEKAKSYFEKSCHYGQKSACWRAKELDVSKQAAYEKRLELQQLRIEYAIKEGKEHDKWEKRFTLQQAELNRPGKTIEERKAFLLKINEENKVWQAEQELRLKQYKKEYEEKRKKIVEEVKKLAQKSN